MHQCNLEVTCESSADLAEVLRTIFRGLVDSTLTRSTYGQSMDEPVLSTVKSEDLTMRVMVIVKASRESEAGVLPSTELLAEMGRFNEELVKAGVMLAGEGLQDSSKGKRVRFEGDKRTVIDGPFAETKELIAGFWLWQVRSMDEAVEWLKRAPFDGGTEVEVRRVFEAEDFGDNMTPEMIEQEKRLAEQAKLNASR